MAQAKASGVVSPKFALGQIVATPAALAALAEAHEDALPYLARHVRVIGVISRTTTSTKMICLSLTNCESSPRTRYRPV
jgi:hypothetical protein